MAGVFASVEEADLSTMKEGGTATAAGIEVGLGERICPRSLSSS